MEWIGSGTGGLITKLKIYGDPAKRPVRTLRLRFVEIDHTGEPAMPQRDIGQHQPAPDVVWRVYQAGHLLPDDDAEINHRMWEFFLRNPRPATAGP